MIAQNGNDQEAPEEAGMNVEDEFAVDNDIGAPDLPDVSKLAIRISHKKLALKISHKNEDEFAVDNDIGASDLPDISHIFPNCFLTNFFDEFDEMFDEYFDKF